MSPIMLADAGRPALVSADGGPANSRDRRQPAGIPFVPRSFTRPHVELSAARFAEPGAVRPARGHMGFGFAPSGTQVGAIALGKLWVVPIAGDPPAFGEPRAVADVPHTAHGIAWSPDEREIAYVRAAEFEDSTRPRSRPARLPGHGAPAESGSRCGRRTAHLAFVHTTADGFRLRSVEARSGTVRDSSAARDLGEVAATWVGETADAPVWSPDSRALLVRLQPHPILGTSAELAFLDGGRRRLDRFADAPIFLQWPSAEALVFARHDRLWTADFDTVEEDGEPRALSTPAIYPRRRAIGRSSSVGGGLATRARRGGARPGRCSTTRP
jgi:hypothetical protein